MRYLESHLKGTNGIGLLGLDPRITRVTLYGDVTRYFEEQVDGIPPAAFVAALQLDGVPCEGLFYEPVYKSSLFPVKASDFPALSWGREKALDLRTIYSYPQAERAAYHEAVWLMDQYILEKPRRCGHDRRLDSQGAR